MSHNVELLSNVRRARLALQRSLNEAYKVSNLDPQPLEFDRLLDQIK